MRFVPKWLKVALLPLAAAAALFVPAVATATVNGSENPCLYGVYTPGQNKFCMIASETWDSGGPIGQWLYANVRGTHSYSAFRFVVYGYAHDGTLLWSSSVISRAGTTYGSNIAVPATWAGQDIYSVATYVWNDAGSNDNYYTKLIWCTTGTTC